MVLRTKNFNILRFHWRIGLLGDGGGGSRKTKPIQRGNCLKGERLGQFPNSRGEGGLGKKEGGRGLRWGGVWCSKAYYGCVLGGVKMKAFFCLNDFIQINWILSSLKSMFPSYRNHLFDLRDKLIDLMKLTIGC